jgi:hypothetical protein
VAALVGVGLVGAGAFYYMKNQPDRAVRDTAPAVKDTSWASAGAVAEYNTLRVYESTSPGQKTYTITDDKGNKVAEASSNLDMAMITPVGTDMFLLKGDTKGSLTGPSYYVLDKNGLRLLSNLPASMVGALNAQAPNKPTIAALGGTKVGFQYCKDVSEIPQGGDPYQCDFRTFDLSSGKETITAQSSTLKEDNAKLKAFSPDKKVAYFMGITQQDTESLKKQVNKITGGGYHYEDDPAVQGLYKLHIPYVILKVELASMKVLSSKKIDVQYTRYGKFWLSPNGEHLVYSNGGEKGEVQYIRIPDGYKATIKLPGADMASEPWSGETSSYDPLFSLDGNYMAFTTYISGPASSSLSFMGIIDLKTRTANITAQRSFTTSSMSDPLDFAGMRWYSNNQLEMTRDQENYRVDTAKAGFTILDNSFGSLVGLADDYR